LSDHGRFFVDPAAVQCENPRMQWMAFPPDLGAAQQARVASLHAGQQRRRFGANSLAKHAPPVAFAH